MQTLEFKWTISRSRDTYGYNICTLYVDGRKVARCNGGGYDMEGTCLGNFIASHYTDRLLALKQTEMPEQSHYDYDPTHSEQLKRSIIDVLYYLRLGETGRATEILNQALSV